MSEKTPTHVMQQMVINANGIIVTTKEYRTYMLDLQGWFMWNGIMYEMHGKNLGAGLTRMTAKKKVWN